MVAQAMTLLEVFYKTAMHSPEVSRHSPITSSLSHKVNGTFANASA